MILMLMGGVCGQIGNMRCQRSFQVTMRGSESTEGPKKGWKTCPDIGGELRCKVVWVIGGESPNWGTSMLTKLPGHSLRLRITQRSLEYDGKHFLSFVESLVDGSCRGRGGWGGGGCVAKLGTCDVKGVLESMFKRQNQQKNFKIRRKTCSEVGAELIDDPEVGRGGSPVDTNVNEASESQSDTQNNSEMPEIRWETCLEVSGELR